jgi:hypothetical protein
MIRLTQARENTPYVWVPQPYALAVALNDQAVAVVLDFVDPLRTVRNLGPAEMQYFGMIIPPR